MDNPRAFISFDFDNDKEFKKLFVGQISNSKTPFDVEDWSSKYSLPQKTWENRIKEKISLTNMVIVLVGNSMSSASGVKKEIEMAKENDVPCFGVYVDGAGEYSTLPEGLKRNRTIKWKWDKISDGIDQCMTEGKNN